MKITKNLVALLLVLCMALSLCACGGEKAVEETEAATEAPVVVTEPAVEETEAVEDDKVVYTITVVDEEGNPIANTMVQICLETCIPGMTNENGTAQFQVVEADYKVSFLTVPEGFVAEESYYFENGSTEMTITLKAVA